jgi:hypothetical protein
MAIAGCFERLVDLEADGFAATVASEHGIGHESRIRRSDKRT